MHPSLKATFNPPAPLEPRQVMPVNAPCWCGSGRKWKKCHRDRDKQAPEPIGKLMDKLRTEMAKGYCLHPEASANNCSSKRGRAHTVQRRGGLAAISEKGHVISAKKGFEDIFRNEGKIVPREVGINNASTFMGFCKIHDDQMFKPIEQKPLILDQQAAFLLSFRALSYEYLAKHAEVRITEIQRELDKGKPFEVQCEIQQYLHFHSAGTKRAIRDLEGWKAEYDKAYKNAKYDNFSFYGVVFSGILPIVACGSFHPEFDFKGNCLQMIIRGDSTFEHVCYNLTVVGEKSIAVLGSSGAPDGPAARFFRSYSELHNTQKANAALYLAFEHLENIYFRPSWWKSLSTSVTDDLTNRFLSGLGLPGTDRNSSSLSNFKFILSDLEVEQELSS